MGIRNGPSAICRVLNVQFKITYGSADAGMTILRTRTGVDLPQSLEVGKIISFQSNIPLYHHDSGG